MPSNLKYYSVARILRVVERRQAIYYKNPQIDENGDVVHFWDSHEQMLNLASDLIFSKLDETPLSLAFYLLPFSFFKVNFKGIRSWSQFWKRNSRIVTEVNKVTICIIQENNSIPHHRFECSSNIRLIPYTQS